MWTEIDTLTGPSGGIFQFSSLDLSAFPAVRLLLSGLRITTDESSVSLVLAVGGSDVTSYRHARRLLSTSGFTAEANSTSASAISLIPSGGQGLGNAAAKSLAGRVTIFHPTVATVFKHCLFELAYSLPTDNSAFVRGTGMMQDGGAVDGIKVQGSSNVTAGTVVLQGLEVS